MKELSIKECFVSRWGEDGVIMEADFSQLEVIGAAIVSNDPMMHKDILDGIDSHCQSASWLNLGFSYEEILHGYRAGNTFFTKLRKEAKAPRFELQYGAGAKSIAENNGISRAQAQGFIDAYYERYEILKQFQEKVGKEVKASIKPSGKRTASGYPIGAGQWRSATGRIYTFHEQESPDWMAKRGVHTSISPTQIANYPMQGFATGDVVPEMLGQLQRGLWEIDWGDESPLLINTVHDSVLLDVPKRHIHLTAATVERIMSNVPERLFLRWGIDTSLPFKVDIEIGEHWNDMKNYEVS